MSKLSPFDFVNDINAGRPGLMSDVRAYEEGDNLSSVLKFYSAFVVNRHYSQFPDSVLYANEVNCIPSLCPKMHFDFLRLAMRPRKRFSKWAKRSADEDAVNAIIEYYGYSRQKAVEAVSILTPEQVEDIKRRVDKGGVE